MKGKEKERRIGRESAKILRPFNDHGAPVGREVWGFAGFPHERMFVSDILGAPVALPPRGGVAAAMKRMARVADAGRIEELLRIFLVNPSDVAFGTAVITPRWLYVLAAATPRHYGDPAIVDETLEAIDIEAVRPGDVVGIGVHTANVLRGMEVGRLAREKGAWVVYGGIHATLYPEELHELGGAHAVVKGDGDDIWAKVLADFEKGAPEKEYDGGRVEGASLRAARWDLIPKDSPGTAK